MLLISSLNILFRSLIIRLGARALVVTILFFVTTKSNAADSYSEFGMIRANIAHYISDHRWLICFEPKRAPETSEVVGFDSDGNFFRIRGQLRPNAKNLLSPESYDKPFIEFSTVEGYLYVWKNNPGEAPFETFIRLNEYERLIKKFEFYPLFESAKDAPLKYELLKENPEFYSRALTLPRPKSTFHFNNPEARRLKVGMYLERRPNTTTFFVQRVIDNSAAASADIKPNDIIFKLAVDGTDVPIENGFPLPNDNSIRILSCTIERSLEGGRILVLVRNIFLQSPLESFLGR